MKIKIKINEGMGCGDTSCPACYGNAHNGEEARMHRTTLAHLIADTKVLLSLIEDGDDLPEWLESKITKAGDYMSSAARYIAGSEAREQGQLEEQVEDEDTLKALAMQAIQNMTPDQLGAVIEMNPPAQQATEPLEEKKSSRCTKVTKKSSSTRKGKKWMKCVKSDSGGYKRIHWGQAGVRVTGKSGNTKRKKSFKARHGCSKAKSNTPKGQACKDWAEE